MLSPVSFPTSQDELQRRARVFRRLRIGVLALVVGYFFLPYDVQVVIPVWLLFLAALGLELDFFLGGYLQARRGRPFASAPNRGPQDRDLSDLGGAQWHDPEHVAEYLDDPEAALEEEPEEEPEPVEWGEPRRFEWRHVVEALAAVAIVAGILFYASRPQGWDAVSGRDRARAEAAFSREATLIAAHPARIGCDTSGEHVGFVQDADGVATVGGTQAYVTPSICDTLYQLAFKHRVQSFSRTARAIAVLAHESWHLRGVRNEGLANCYGFQSGVQIGVHLGLSKSKAHAMMREQLATNASDASGQPEYLVPSGCRDGGSEDLHPSAHGFP
jgi:hypothetical protein